MVKAFIKKFLAAANYIIKGNFYSLRRGVIWPEEEYKRGMLKRIQKIFQYDYFVETGTYYGGTPEKLRSYFKHIWTIELDDKLFTEAQQRLCQYNNIECIHGDSGVVLRSLIKKIDKPAIFFLDGHYSGSGTGQSENPIVKELEAIGRSPVKTHVIVIDDASSFNIKESGIALSEVIRRIEEINRDYKIYFDYDMLFAIPSDEDRFFWRKIVYPVVIR